MIFKEFYEEWGEHEINEYLDQFGILILFKVHLSSHEAGIVIHGDITETQSDQLKGLVIVLFGGASLSRALCGKINEFAEKWHNKIVLKKKARVVNFRRKGK